MSNLAEPHIFNFPGKSTLDKVLTEEEIIKFSLENYCVAIPKIKPDELIVKGTIIPHKVTQEITKAAVLSILCYPVELGDQKNIISPPQVITIISGTAFFRTDPKSKTGITRKGDFDFSDVNYNFNFTCNAILFYAKPIDHDVTVMFSFSKKSKLYS